LLLFSLPNKPLVPETAGPSTNFFVCSVRSAISRNISGLSRQSRRISVSANSVAAFGVLAGLLISLIRAKAKDAVGSSDSLYIRRYRCGNSITSMEMTIIRALPICDMRRDLGNLGNSADVKGAQAATAPAMAPASRSGSARTPTSTPARTRCRRAEGATKCRHWAECFGGGMQAEVAERHKITPHLPRTSAQRYSIASVGAGEHGWQDFQAERFGVLEVDETLAFEPKPRLSLSGLHG
jgi:hypothetical protein